MLKKNHHFLSFLKTLLFIVYCGYAQGADEWIPSQTNTCPKIIDYFNKFNIFQNPFKVVACADSSGLITTIPRSQIGADMYNSNRKFKQFLLIII
ncbi:MAG: hypothetical protein QE271_06775 [Bacteriovoracaceae bacterium]|nr:hypothetical protein [Bacteriovoracaceae bacterium]